MKLEVTTPDDHLGDVINDLQQRRAIINSTENRGGIDRPRSRSAAGRDVRLLRGVRSLSQGRATFSMEPFKYGPAPPDVQASFI